MQKAFSSFLMFFVGRENEHYFAQKIVLAKKEFLNNWYLIKRGEVEDQRGKRRKRAGHCCSQINNIYIQFFNKIHLLMGLSHKSSQFSIKIKLNIQNPSGANLVIITYDETKFWSEILHPIYTLFQIQKILTENYSFTECNSRTGWIFLRVKNVARI